MRNLTHICPVCDGDGRETCHNPDHGFISIHRELSGLGCPVCGYDEYHKVVGGGSCEGCNGAGRVTELECQKHIKDYELEDSADEFKYPGGVSILLP